MPVAATPSAPPAFKRAALFTMLGSWQSWWILMYLAKGEGYTTIGEIAPILNTSRDGARKQLNRLVASGILTRGSNKIYKLRAGLQPDRTVPVLDFGHCLLRLNHPDPE